MQELRSELAENIEPHNGLLTRLLGKKVLTYTQFQQIRSKTNVPDRNDVLLSCLLDNEEQIDFKEVLTSFRKTGQKHIEEFIRNHGKRPTRLYNFNSVQTADYYSSNKVVI